MTFLIVTDCHGGLMTKHLVNHDGYAVNLTDEKPDIVLFLGDNYYDDLEIVLKWLKNQNWDIPMCGVFGNHDSPSFFDRLGIPNIHMNVVNVNGIKIGGFGGAVRYKSGHDDIMFTQEDCINLLNDLPKCDIFITHSNPQYREFEEVDITPPPASFKEVVKRKIFGYEPVTKRVERPFGTRTHDGLIGIGDYIDNKQPRLHFYGHIHDITTEQRGNTTLRSFYGVQTVSIDI